jgi:hypothetical protein
MPAIHQAIWFALVTLVFCQALSGPSAGAGGSQEAGGAFVDHGVATPISNHRGIVATVDGQGRNVVLVWLFDHRGGYALLLIDAETGKAEQFRMPFPPGGDCPYASILSSRNKFYTHFNSHFVEFDPVSRGFTFEHATAPQMAMGMTEDDQGVIWSVTYPKSGVVSFDPKTRQFKDYGHLHKENWEQYQRHVAADAAGWIYFGIGSTRSLILGLDPVSGQAKAMFPEAERIQGAAEVHRDLNGKVYGWPGGGTNNWYEFYQGEGRKVGARPDLTLKPIITASQALFHRGFPDGQRVTDCDLVERVLVISNPKTGKTVRHRFEYTSEGANIMNLAVAPDGTICGGTAFPMRFFSFDPATDRWTHREAFGQWNTVTRLDNRFFVGTYTHGGLLEWDPSRPWVSTVAEKAGSNPRLLAQAHNTINRPHKVLATPDGHWLVLAGTPGYGMTGGGLLIWDRTAQTHTLLEHTNLLPEHSTLSLLALPEGKLLGGSTTIPGTGGEKKARVAELYLLDLPSRKVEWHEPLLKGVNSYCDLAAAPKGLVYGFADSTRFFVFDPVHRSIVHDQNVAGEFGRTSSGQGPRIFVREPKGTTYVLFRSGIARVEPETYKLTLIAKSPVSVDVGGDWLAGRIYFASGSHLYGYTLASVRAQMQ